MSLSHQPQHLEAVLQGLLTVVAQATLEGEMTAKGMVPNHLPRTVSSKGGRSGLLLTHNSHIKCL